MRPLLNKANAPTINKTNPKTIDKAGKLNNSDITNKQTIKNKKQYTGNNYNTIKDHNQSIR